MIAPSFMPICQTRRSLKFCAGPDFLCWLLIGMGGELFLVTRHSSFIPDGADAVIFEVLAPCVGKVMHREGSGDTGVGAPL
jgi:hypothetical protein